MIKSGLELAKEAAELLGNERRTRRQERLQNAEYVRQMARITEALRISLHEVASALRAAPRGGGPTQSILASRFKVAATEFEEVLHIWFMYWMDVRPELDRYVDAGIVLHVRSLRHDLKATLDNLLGELQGVRWPPSQRSIGRGAHPKELDPVPPVLHQCLGQLDELLHHLNAVRIVTEKGGVGSNRSL